MKLNEHFVYNTVDGVPIIAPVGDAPFCGLVEANPTAGVILELLSRGATEEEIVSALCERYRGGESEIRADVSRVLNELRAIGAIDD